MITGRNELRQSKRWVIKIGSALLTNNGQGLDWQAIQQWVDQIAALKKAGIEVVLVSSGSIAEGMTRLGWHNRPPEVYKLQAAAAVGQMGLVQAYETNFSRHNIVTAQVLLTREDHANRKRYLNSQATLRTLLALDVVPIINENDTVVTKEIRFGDNDTLGALVANLIEADALIILTDQQGLFTADPRKDSSATLIDVANAEDESLGRMAGEGGALGQGGMITKVRAAKLASGSGAVTLIASGREPDILVRLHQGEKLGSLLVSENNPVTARKQWIAGHLQARGNLTLDKGAVIALCKRGKSLLPAGITAVNGDFSRGEMVTISDDKGQVFARGLVNYGIEDASKIIGKPSTEINNILGFTGEEELVHRDNMVLL